MEKGLKVREKGKGLKMGGHKNIPGSRVIWIEMILTASLCFHLVDNFLIFSPLSQKKIEFVFYARILFSFCFLKLRYS